jgi:hypothetical protein
MKMTLSVLRICTVATDAPTPALSLMIRCACLSLCVLLIYGLFHYGAQPIAVGLFVPPVDKIAHAGVFGLIALMLWFFFDRKYPLLVIGLVAMTGAVDEVHQLFLPGRFAEVSDWIADVVGAGLPLFALMASRKKCSKSVDNLPSGNMTTKTPGNVG